MRLCHERSVVDLSNKNAGHAPNANVIAVFCPRMQLYEFTVRSFPSFTRRSMQRATSGNAEMQSESQGLMSTRTGEVQVILDSRNSHVCHTVIRAQNRDTAQLSLANSTVQRSAISQDSSDKSGLVVSQCKRIQVRAMLSQISMRSQSNNL